MKCSEMELGQVYTCEDCGIELKVVKECDCEGESCSCAQLECCSGQLSLKG